MNRWITYINDRFPQIFWAATVGGIAISGNHLYEKSFQFFPFLLVFIGTWLFLFLLRLMNDSRDLEKDRTAHPDYPLPRGLFDPKEVYKVILILQIVLFAYSEVLWIFLQEEVPALFYLVLAVYSWLFYKNFWIPNLLERYPLVRTLSHQLFALPLAFFSLGASQPAQVFGDRSWGFALVLLSAFIVYDLCQKLNPKLHPILGTPIHFYGYKNVFTFIVCALLLGTVGADKMERELLLWPMQIAVFVTLIAVFFEKEAYKAAEFTATISLLIHCWAGVF